MGYTHYWELNKNSKIKDLSGCLENIKKVVLQFGDVQFEEDNDKLPLITKNLIRFNGIGEDGHETFYFEFPPQRKINDWNKYNSENNNFIFYFCKTAIKPYDEAVTRCLLILKEYLKEDMKLSSDGDFSNQEEWGQAIKEVQNMGIDIIPHIIIQKL